MLELSETDLSGQVGWVWLKLLC